MRRVDGALGVALFDGPEDCYRLRLDYRIDDLECAGGPTVALIGVNPSTACGQVADPTMRRILGFARLHGWGEIAMLNLFAWRAADVRALASVADPIGPANDETILATLQAADIAIACWGASAKLPPRLRNRWRDIRELADKAGKNLLCFGIAQDGHPLHPLMLPYSKHLQLWRAPA